MPIIGPMPNVDPIANRIEHFQALEGPWLVGTALQAMLFGVIVVQSYDYFVLYRKDGKALRAFVAAMVLLNLLDTIMNIAAVYDRYITNFGNLVYLFQPPQFEVEHLIFSSTIVTFAQGFFAARSYKVNKNIWLAGLMVALTVVTGVTGYVLAYDIAIAESGQSIGGLLIVLQLQCWAGVACDVLISAVFAHQMHASTRGFNASTDNVLGKLLRMSLGTAAITTVLVIMDALSFLFNNTTSNFFVLTGLIISRAYTCCVLYVLNARSGLRLVADGVSTNTGNAMKLSRFGNVAGSEFTGVTVHLDTIVAHDTAELPYDVKDARY